MNSDIIHLRRPDGRDWDGIMHVNPQLKEKGLVMLYNPLKRTIQRTITLPLYYTGIKTSAKIIDQNKKEKTYKLDRTYHVEIQVKIPAQGYTWLVVESS